MSTEGSEDLLGFGTTEAPAAAPMKQEPNNPLYDLMTSDDGTMEPHTNGHDELIFNGNQEEESVNVSDNLLNGDSGDIAQTQEVDLLGGGDYMRPEDGVQEDIEGETEPDAQLDDAGVTMEADDVNEDGQQREETLASPEPAEEEEEVIISLSVFCSVL